ncbi:MAG: class I SAM-dependent methyltransferase, partial [Hyphomicrobiales bacterium]|nr:class I SAM-dependent methyltransferase [Hyphomicrobiales bacterium]
MASTDGGSQTHFGFSTVRLDEKQGLVDDVFRQVARRYDLMNDLMSFGVHRAWKNEFVAMLPPHAFSVIDVAGGTGDVAFRIVDAKGRRARVT